MSQLARAILGAPAPSPHSPHITLGDGSQWPVLDSPVLFVRSFYAAVYDGVMGSARDGFVDDGVRFRKLCVSGNPGIGKSSFGYCALFRALREGRTVVYQAEKLQLSSRESRYLFRGSFVVTDMATIDEQHIGSATAADLAMTGWALPDTAPLLVELTVC
jgi:hypothetical protein